MSARLLAISRKHWNVEFVLSQEILGETPRAVAAFDTHTHLLVSRSLVVHQRMVLSQLSVFLKSISLPLLKYVATDIFSGISITWLSSCIILLKETSQESINKFISIFNHPNNLGLRVFAISLKKKRFVKIYSSKLFRENKIFYQILTF